MKSSSNGSELWGSVLDGCGLTGGGGQVGGHGQQKHQRQQFDVHAGAAAALALRYNPGTSVTSGWAPGGVKAAATEREAHFLRREGGREGGGVGGGGGETSSFVNVLAGNQGESLEGVPFLFLLFPLFCPSSFVIASPLLHPPEHFYFPFFLLSTYV